MRVSHTLSVSLTMALFFGTPAYTQKTVTVCPFLGDCYVSPVENPKHPFQDCGVVNGKSVICDPRDVSKGPCCSTSGACGNGPLYCGEGCQSRFGLCWARTESTERTKRCGKAFGNTKCENGDCCSATGWCGKGNDFCSVPQQCQRAFGRCDSDAMPKGLDLAPPQHPRRQTGKVPYGQEISKCTKPRSAALTFDDGPSNNTVKILDVLRRHGAKATFFLSGNTNAKGMIDNTEVWIRVIKQIIMDGHQIGSHTWSHPHLDTLDRNARIFDMVRNDRAIANIVGKFPSYMRPPYLQCSGKTGCLDDMTKLAYHVIAFDVDSHDWQEKTSLEQMKQNIDSALNKRTPEDNIMIIQHDQNKHAAELADYALGQIEKKQWKAVTIGECLEDPADNWYQTPVWVEPKSIAQYKDIHRGCVASEQSFCGQIFPFSNKDECLHAWHECKTLLHNHCSRGTQACVSYQAICAKQIDFCKKCGRAGESRCDIDEWTFSMEQ